MMPKASVLQIFYLDSEKLQQCANQSYDIVSNFEDSRCAPSFRTVKDADTSVVLYVLECSRASCQ